MPVPIPAFAESPPSPAGPPQQPLAPDLWASSARLSRALSPHAALGAWEEWGLHLAHAPDRQLALACRARENALKLAAWLARAEAAAAPPFAPGECDHRFDHPAWDRLPFRAWQQGFLALQDWWDEATAPLRGLDPRDAARVRFLARQGLDMLSPSNLPWASPELLEETARQGGRNLAQGAAGLARDIARTLGRHRAPPPAAPAIGRDLACTPGKVVFRNDLMELIQYAPATPRVRPEPVLIVPAWIMKYYILDLSPENSMVRHLVDQGFTVFMISWVNPTPDHALLSLDDYRRHGVMKALEVMGEIVANAPVHAVGYCLGGMMLAIAAAAMARDGDGRLASVTLLATQLDFTETGELLLFLDDTQIARIEELMWAEGVLDRPQAGRGFAAMRTGDLIFSRVVRRYFLGREDMPADIGLWLADITRMPARMHSEYLRGLVLENRLAAGRFAVDGRAISLADITAPLFVVATEADHIAPWQSVCGTQAFGGCELTLVLADGGHNTGIVCAPGEQGRHYRLSHRPAGAPSTAPARWREDVAPRPGSWWPDWFAWLASRSGRPGPPPAPGARGLAPLGDAPGTYIHQL